MLQQLAVCRLMKVASGGPSSNAVDLYNSASDIWSTARLSQGRRDAAATCVGNVAIFAGGITGGHIFMLKGCC